LKNLNKEEMSTKTEIEESKTENKELDNESDDSEEETIQFLQQPSHEFPDLEIKQKLEVDPKIPEATNIRELTYEEKKEYQIRVNKLKEIRSFYTEASTNFTAIHSKYDYLTNNLNSSMFTQVDHEALTTLIYIFIDLYYSFFDGSDQIAK
jgi:hypothetical protein